MKLIDILETLSPDNAETVHWRASLDGGWWGPFFINEKTFIITVSKETLDQSEKILGLRLPDFLKNKLVWRIDFGQIIGNDLVFTDTKNSTPREVLKIMSTVANNAEEKLRETPFNVIYFAAKSHEDESDNPRKRIYPKIAKIMAKRTSALAVSFGHKDAVVSAIVKGLDLAELDEFTKELDAEV